MLAKLSLFENEDGYRYQLWVTNLPETTKGWRGKNAYIDAAHRVHARVEDAIRTGKDTGIGRYPSHEAEINQAWMTGKPRGTGPPAGRPPYPHSKIPAICTAGPAVSGSQLPACRVGDWRGGGS
jgi:hypothetical protein